MRAMQQQLSSLHVVLEQTAGEHERRVQQLEGEVRHAEEQKQRYTVFIAVL